MINDIKVLKVLNFLFLIEIIAKLVRKIVFKLMYLVMKMI